MSQYLVDDRLILNTGDHPGVTSARRAHRDIDVEHAFQALRPGHGLVALCGCFVFVFVSDATFAAFGWRHINTVFAVGGKYAMTNSSGMNLDNEVARRVRKNLIA